MGTKNVVFVLMTGKREVVSGIVRSSVGNIHMGKANAIENNQSKNYQSTELDSQ